MDHKIKRATELLLDSCSLAGLRRLARALKHGRVARGTWLDGARGCMCPLGTAVLARVPVAGDTHSEVVDAVASAVQRRLGTTVYVQRFIDWWDDVGSEGELTDQVAKAIQRRLAARSGG